MYTNHRHYILLILAFITMTVSIVGYVFLYNTIRSQSIDATNSLHQVALANEAKQQAEDTASVYTKTTDARAQLANVIIPQDKIVDLIKSIESIGDEVGAQLDLTGIASDPASAKSNWNYFKGHVEVHGTWTQAMRALEIAENMPYDISLSNVKLMTSANAPTASDLPAQPRSKINPTDAWVVSFDVQVLTTK